MASMDDNADSPRKPERLANTRLMYYVGLIDTEQVGKFQKMVYRITRGKVLVTTRDIGSVPSIFDHMGQKYKSLNEKDDQKTQSKSLLFMFFVGQDSLLGKKVKTITSIFDVYHVPLPNGSEEVKNLLVDTQKQRDEMAKVVRKTVDEIHSILDYFVRTQENGVSKLDELMYMINRERVISKVLSQLEPHNDLYSIKLWIDADKKQEFISSLNEFCSSRPNMTRPIINTIKFDKERTKPPTKFDLNEFTAPFQQIVETYAIPRYKEINPAPFTAASFPFLFGVMFGDACHGLILFIFGLYLLLRCKEFKARGGVYEVLASLRYMITLLGFFSFYNGLIYNDFASVPLILADSCWSYHDINRGGKMVPHFDRKPDCVYPFGIDWAWYYNVANDIPFMNSFKMKVAIILGVLQMLFGLVLKAFNAFHFGSAVDFFFEFIPQFLFLGSLFGYMILLIVVKWLTDWTGRTPPQIINIFTSLNKVEPQNVLLGDLQLQQQIQTVILCRLLLTKTRVWSALS